MERRYPIYFVALSLLPLLATSCQQPASDPGAANIDLVRQLFAAIDASDLALLREFAADDYVGVTDSLDLDAIEEGIRNSYTAFPDYMHQIDEMIAEGDRVAIRVTYRGTHQGEFEGIAPTGSAVTYTGVFLHHSGWQDSTELDAGRQPRVDDPAWNDAGARAGQRLSMQRLASSRLQPKRRVVGRPSVVA